MNQFRLATMIARTTQGTHNPRISAQTVTNGLREIGKIRPYTMYVLYAAFLFWPTINYIGLLLKPADQDIQFSKEDSLMLLIHCLLLLPIIVGVLCLVLVLYCSTIKPV